MIFQFNDDGPIIACSTSTTSNAAIGIIRISGFENLEIFQPFFSYSLTQVQPRKIYNSEIKDGNEILDFALIAFFKSPQSYNGENILEISVHGNQINIQRIISVFVSSNIVRHAAPGEFTYRALKNKKLSLSQVEGLDLVLNAKSSLMLTQGQALLHGNLHSHYKQLHDSFLKLKSSVELSIDFLEDVGEEKASEYFQQSFKEFFNFLIGLNKKIQGTLGSILSPDILIIGQTNAGKSSLFNCILSAHRSIVSSCPGTTRDYISEYIYIKNTHFILIDTAGIREAQDSIENEGILRALNMASSAFYKILVINPFETDHYFFTKYQQIQFDLIIFTHQDLPDFAEEKDKLTNLPLSQFSINLSLKDGPIGPANLLAKSGPIEPLFETSMSTQLTEPNEGLERIFHLIHQRYLELTKDDPIIIERHRGIIRDLYSSAFMFEKLVANERDMGIISYELNNLGHLVSELIGIVAPEEVLSSIFNNFCIGK